MTYCPYNNFGECFNSNLCEFWLEDYQRCAVAAIAVSLSNIELGLAYAHSDSPGRLVSSEEWVEEKGCDWFDGLNTGAAYKQYISDVEAGEVGGKVKGRRGLSNLILKTHPDLRCVYVKNKGFCFMSGGWCE